MGRPFQGAPFARPPRVRMRNRSACGRMRELAGTAGGALADMALISLVTLAIGLILGAVVGFLIARNREANALTDLAARASAADERARAAEQRTALVDGQLAERFQALLPAQAFDTSTPAFSGYGGRTARHVRTPRQPMSLEGSASPPWRAWSSR